MCFREKRTAVGRTPALCDLRKHPFFVNHIFVACRLKKLRGGVTALQDMSCHFCNAPGGVFFDTGSASASAGGQEGDYGTYGK
jgi:hypothetical protein